MIRRFDTSARVAIGAIVLAVACGGEEAPTVDAPDVPTLTDTGAPTVDTSAPTDTNILPPTDADTSTPNDVPPVVEVTCQAYCDSIQTLCKSTATQYPDLISCLAFCENGAGGWSTGSASDVNGNSLGCRVARLAEIDPNEPKLSCGKAGPSGGNQCGAWCEVYCELAIGHCATEENFFASFEDCKQACNSFSTAGSPNDPYGDTVQCRITHLVARSSGAETCADGAPDGGLNCTYDAPTCDQYCAAVQTGCATGGPHEQFPSMEACQAFCTASTIPLGTLGATHDHTIACRLNAATKAAAAPDWYCPLAGPSGGGVCGSWCKNYCHLAGLVCTGDTALFDATDECLFACGGIPDEVPWGADNGNSIQCRLHHLVVGLTTGDAELIPTFCAAADPYALTTCVVPPPAPTCDVYCDMALQACGEADGPNAQFLNKDACMSFCASGAVPDGAGDDQEGNTIGCRYNQALNALKSPTDATGACPGTGPDGGGICGSRCEVFCAMSEKLCVGDNLLFGSVEACMKVCQTMPEHAPEGVSTTDTVACRLEELEQLTTTTPDGSAFTKQCGAAQYIGSSVCYDPEPSCEDYCDTIQSTCTEEAAQYPDWDSCLVFCVTSGYPLGEGADTEGHSVSCRTNWAKTALLDKSVGAACGAAGPAGDGVCGSLCDAYCSLATSLCADENLLYESPEICATDCPGIKGQGLIGDLYGDSLQCRFTHLQAAVFAPDALANHCAQAAFSGGTDCSLGAGPPPVTYVEHVQPILQTHCTPCHEGPEPGTCSGSSCFVSDYEELTKSSYYCPGEKKGACVLTRMMDGSMPLVGELVPPEATSVIEKWLVDGMLKE